MRSVMDQTLQDIEILVIDGGSTDGTLEIIDGFSKIDTRIHKIDSASGVGHQFNTGLRAARGEYIGICESDDYLLPTMYERQYAMAQKYHLDMLRSDAIHFFEDNHGKEYRFPVKLSKEDALYGKVLDVTKDYRVLQLGINSFWSGLYRREFLLKEKIFMNETKGAAYQDTSFSFLTSVKARKTMLSREAFYCYRLDNPDSSVNNPKRITMLNDEYALLKKRLTEEKLFERYKAIYLSWKIKGYLGFYDSLSAKLRDEYENLMYLDLQKEFESIEFIGDEFSQREKEVISVTRQSVIALHQYLYQIYKGLRDTRQELEEISDEEDIIIFGNGDMGRLIYLYLQSKKKNIVAFIDNNQKLWGSKVENISTMEPERAIRQFPEGIYIIANVNYFQEMKSQLISYSVREKNIIVCSDYGYFFKHILLNSLKDINE